jgi:hypothetical protein
MPDVAYPARSVGAGLNDVVPKHDARRILRAHGGDREQRHGECDGEFRGIRSLQVLLLEQTFKEPSREIEEPRQEPLIVEFS